MPDLAKMTAAPAPLKFVDGSTYQMSPLTDKDIAELDEWVRARHIQIAVESTKDMADEDKAELRQVALLQAGELSWMSGTGARLMATVDGMTRLVWQSCKKNHPELTEAALREKIFDPRNVDEANKMFEHLNLPAESGDKKRLGKRVKPRRKRKGRRRN